MRITNLLNLLNLLKLGWVFFVCGLCTLALARESVVVAGFSFAGDYKDIPTRFPKTWGIFEKNSLAKSTNPTPTFSFLINERMKGVDNSNYLFKTDGSLVNLKHADQALMTTLLLTAESIGTDKVGDYYKTYVNLRANALIFDFKTLSIVKNYPLNVVLFDATKEVPTDDELTKYVDKLIVGNDASSLIGQFAQKLSLATPINSRLRTVKVENIQIDPNALEQMPAAFQASPSMAQAMIADAFESYFVDQLGVTMLPNTIGYAIGGVLPLRMENGDDYQLKLGTADYLFDLSLDKFIKKEVSKNDIAKTDVYGVYMHIKFYEPLLNTVYLDTAIKNGEASVVPIDQVSENNFAGYQAAMNGLFSKFSKALSSGDESQWLSSATGNSDIDKQIQSTKRVLGK